MISGERYEEIQEIAYSVIIDHVKSDSLPINLLEIIKDINNLEIKDYQSLMNNSRMSLSDVIRAFKSEDGALLHESNSDEYRIIFNNEINSNGRIRFTIAHELGHYFLGHKMKNKILCRFSSESENYNDEEKEANYFAKRLLAPLPIIKLFCDKFGYIDSLINKSLFNISNKASEYIMDNYNKIGNYHFQSLYDLLIANKFEKCIDDFKENPLLKIYFQMKINKNI